jgi:hypothetical protein
MSERLTRPSLHAVLTPHIGLDQVLEPSSHLSRALGRQRMRGARQSCGVACLVPCNSAGLGFGQSPGRPVLRGSAEMCGARGMTLGQLQHDTPIMLQATRAQGLGSGEVISCSRLAGFIDCRVPMRSRCCEMLVACQGSGSPRS